MAITETTVNVKVRGFRIYVQKKNDDLYDFFIPTSLNRLALKQVQHFVDDSDTIIAIKRNNQDYEVAIDDIQAFGKLLN